MNSAGTIPIIRHLVQKTKFLKNKMWLLLMVTIGSLSFSSEVYGQCQNVTNPGLIGGEQSSCQAFDPNIISSEQPASGGSGTVEYLWL